jgi:hypothetical protein
MMDVHRRDQRGPLRAGFRQQALALFERNSAPEKTRALVVAAARRIFDTKYRAKTRDFGSISGKNTSIFARIPSFSPRFNRWVASCADAEHGGAPQAPVGRPPPKSRVKSACNPPLPCAAPKKRFT